MFDTVHRAADGGHITTHAGSRFVLAHQDRLDTVAFVGFHSGQVFIDGRAFAPDRLDQFDFESESATHVGPQMAELTEARDKDFCAEIEAVGECRLPTSRTGRWKKKGMSSDGFEDRL